LNFELVLSMTKLVNLSNSVHLRLNTDKLLHMSVSHKMAVIQIVTFQSSC